MIIGTAGHVDHGKTALVKALTGIDADRLAEEKRRGITIDLGYAYTDAFGFVDVPGHERFVHTMLAGASGVDAALLVVALDDGVMPQTREHVQILQLLGIDRGVVALTKADLAPERETDVTVEVRALLAETALAAAPLLTVSAVTGAGIEALRGALLALGPRHRDVDLYPRLAVDRAFTLAGAGLVVTGTLVAGCIRVEDRLMLSPPGIELRVRGLHAQNRPANQAVAGQRVALNVTGPRLSKDAVTRGDWVLHPEVHAPTARFDIRLCAARGGSARAACRCAGASASRGGPCDGACRGAGRRQDRTRQHRARASDARSADRCAGARSAGAARCGGDAHHRRRCGDRSVPAAAWPAHAGTARATCRTGSAGSHRCIACAADIAAWVDRSRRIPAGAQPAAVDGFGHDGGTGRRPADVAGNAGVTAQRRGRASRCASCGRTGSAGTAG